MNKTCPKCSGAMERGFLLDRSYSTMIPLEWFEGAPRKSFWLGTTTKGLRHSTVETWRCKTCGFLESYAPEK